MQVLHPVLCAIATLVTAGLTAQSLGFNYAFTRVQDAPAMNSAGLTFDEARSYWLMFGGEVSGYFSCHVTSGATWTSDGLQWTQRTPQGPTPSARSGCVLVYDRLRNNSVLFGGESSNVCSVLGDTWVWNGTAWQQQFPAHSPSARAGAAATWDPSRSGVMLHGGGLHGDTWRWDGQDWQLVTTGLPAEGSLVFDDHRSHLYLISGTDGLGAISNSVYELIGSSWVGRASHLYGAAGRTCVFDARVNEVLSFGGVTSWLGGAPVTNGLAAFDGTRWVSLSPIGSPFERSFAAAARDPATGRILLTGGRWGSSAGYIGRTGETYLLDPVAPVSYTPAASTTRPSPRHSFGIATLEANNSACLFGGTDGIQDFADTWTFSAAQWTKQFPLHSPTVRHGHSMTGDGIRGVFTLFGGISPAGTARGDTWNFDGLDWTELHPAIAPTPRSSHATSFDRVNNRVILFGGMDGSQTILGDTWAFDGGLWTQLAPSTPPAARFDHSMATDLLRNRIVLFGGTAITGLSSEVWEWDGSQWANVAYSSLSTPGVRTAHTMAWDAAAERVVVFGGRNTTSACDDHLWSWNGASWSLHMTANVTPAARAHAGITQDPGSGRTLLVGGECGGSLQDQWIVELPTYSRISAYGASCVGSRGTLGLQVAPGSGGVLGSNLSMLLSNVPGPFTVSLGVLGFNRSTFVGLPIPVDLVLFGLPSCYSWTSAEQTYTLPFPNASGASPWTFPLPNNSYLLGLEVYFQGFSFEAPGFPRWGTTSNALAVRLGNS